ncbi:MAG: preprotein translocase subunit SecG [Candidatus Berkelbacteria bacterium]|nr:preprotein translocase subunit SecG [Candidatus Berkelbacteria bacterium]
MIKILTVSEFILAALIVASVLLQQRGTGLGGAFASEANAYRSKRGIEKLLYRATILFAVLLIVSVLAHLYLRLTTVTV